MILISDLLMLRQDKEESYKLHIRELNIKSKSKDLCAWRAEIGHTIFYKTFFYV